MLSVRDLLSARCGRGIVARSNPRFVVGVGVISAFLLIGGPGMTLAIADPGHSGRSDRDKSDRDWGDSRGGSKRGGDDDYRGGGGDNRRSGGDSRRSDERPSLGDFDAPQSRVGSGRTDIQQLMPEEDSGSSDRSGSEGSSDRSGSDRSGSDQPGAATGQFEPPRVTFGNGRSPAAQDDDDREPRFRVSVPEPAPAPPPPPPPPPPDPPKPSWPERIYTPSATVSKQLGVAPAADWSEPLWGVAGLLLIPAAGAVLGYRQARGAQDAAKLYRP
jgi:hypothetical protein